MRILLAALMCMLLTSAECFALKGGPIYPGGSNLAGVYAGVMQGAFDPTNPASSNSIGIFSLGVPTTGNATGAFVMFSRGRVFTGTANAFADPQKASLKGIVQATYNYSLYLPITDTDATGKTTTTISTIAVTASANGPLDATVAASKSASLSSVATTVLTGTATLNISEGHVDSSGDPEITSILSLVVSGVKQSNVAPTSTTSG